jgi:hypothetical protein
VLRWEITEFIGVRTNQVHEKEWSGMRAYGSDARRRSLAQRPILRALPGQAFHQLGEQRVLLIARIAHCKYQQFIYR